MRLVEQHGSSKQDPCYAVIDAACFASKNLYNASNYIVRQAFIFDHVYKGYAEVYHEVKHSEAYKALPAKVANEVLRLLDKNWKSYREACKAWNEDPSKFLGPPKLPKYKDKQQGRTILIYDIQALSKKGLKKGLIQPSMLHIEVSTKHMNVQQVRSIPRKGVSVVEVVYEVEPVQACVDPSLIASIDSGVNNLAAITSNKVGFIPQLVNGRPSKSSNQFYNKRKADLQAIIKPETRFTPGMERMTIIRTRRIDHSLLAHSEQADYCFAGSRRDRHASHWQKSQLEAKVRNAQEGDPTLCANPACSFRRYALLQSCVSWYPGDHARGKLYQQSELS